MRRVLAMTAALGTAAFVLTVSPSAHADPPPVGEPCSMSTSDQGHPGFQTGWVQGGPVVGEVEAGPFAIRCSIQIDVEDPFGQDAASAEGAPGNPAVLPPAMVGYSAGPGAHVYLCTEYVYAGKSEYHDADPNQPGIQCQQAQRTEGPGYQSYAVPNLLCVYVPMYEPRTGACVPFPDIWAIIDPRQ